MIKNCDIGSNIESQMIDEDCLNICKEFNVNKMSYMYDGEARFIRDFLYELNGRNDYKI